MTTETVFPLASYASGSTPFAAVSVADTDITLQFRLRRCTAVSPEVWPSTETFVRVDMEIDLGAGFIELLNGNVEGWGGVQKNKFGVDIEWMSVGIHLPAGTSRQVRGTMTITDGPVYSEGELILFDS